MVAKKSVTCDALQHVGVEVDDESRHGCEVALLVEAEVLGFCRHCVQGFVRLRVESIPVGEDVEQPQSPMGADHVVGQCSGFELLDEVRPTDVEDLRSLHRGELGVERDDRHPATGLQDVNDRYEQGVDTGRQLDRGAIGPDESRGLADPGGVPSSARTNA